MQVGDDAVFVNWMPHFHDMGLLGNILYPLILGAQSVQMAPFAFIQRPSRWLAAISRFGGTISGGPLFAFDLCTRNISEEQLAGLDLSRWHSAFCGAEPVFHAVLESFRRRFAPAGFQGESLFGCYGLAETSLYVAGARPTNEPVIPSQPTGKEFDRVPCYATPEMKETIRIVDPLTRHPVTEGESGEIWICSDSVGSGYFDEPDATAKQFSARTIPDDGRFYLRTGDIGHLHGEWLTVTGRLKDVLIVNGTNFSASDIEWIAGNVDSVLNPLAAAAFHLDDEDHGEVALLIEVRDKSVDCEQSMKLASLIRETVATELGLTLANIQLLPRGSLPKTSSGKVRRLIARTNFMRMNQ